MEDCDDSTREEFNDEERYVPNSKRNRIGSPLTSKNGSKSMVNKESEEYLRKRARNNLAVKKSRDRSKQRILETQKRVEQLTKENEDLQTRVTLLTKELNVLRALFTNGAFTVPCNLQIVASPRSDTNSERHSQEDSRITNENDMDSNGEITKIDDSCAPTMVQDKQNYTSVIRSTRPSPRISGPDLRLNVSKEHGDRLAIKRE